MKKLMFCLVLFFAFTNAKATHLMGGEITWECIKAGPNTGKYIFNVKVYRDCQGIPISTSMSLDAHNVPGIDFIPLTYLGANDISPSCNTINGPNMQFSCGGVNVTSGNGNGAVEEHIYQSDPISLSGNPDANGWHFTWSSCCRNSNITNGLADAGFTLRAVMYSYTDSLGQVLPISDQCHDSSPKFYERPRTILEVGNGYDPFAFSNGFTYSHNAFDEEKDSISYTWGIPLDGYGYDYLNPNSTSLPFSAPYSYTNPINNIFLNSTTGRTWYPANQQGNFVTCTKVSAFKCGQLVSEIFREIQVVIIPPTCNLGDTTNGNIGADTLCNVRPSVQPPFFYPGTPAPFQWDTLAHCGDTISFDFNAIDNDVYPNGSQQDLLFEVSGGQFYDYFNNIPCQNPPCATFNEINTGATPPFIASGGSGSGVFEWITSCNHLVNSCGTERPSVYTFVIKVSDDFCPSPAIEMTSQVISITVYPSCDNLKTNVSTTPASCLNNGSAQASPSGGTPPYVAYWFDMNGMPVSSNSLAAGDYIIRVTDSTQCESVDTITVAGPSILPLNTSSSAIMNCYGGSNGSIASFQTGGQAPYTYLWSNGETTQSISNLVAGTYILNVTDANSCEVTDSIIVMESTQILPSITNSNGVLIGNTTGGVAPYTYQFIDPNGLLVSISSNNLGNNDSITPIVSGDYTFVAIDANGCSDSASMNFSIDFSPAVTVTLSNTNCNSLADLTIEVIQDSGEVDMSSSLFESNIGSFDIASMNVGDTIGTATLMSGGGLFSINTYIMVSAINANQVVVVTCDSLLGCVSSFGITNQFPGISVLTSLIPDGNSSTAGNMSSITFTNSFFNPCAPLIFTSTITSEMGDIDIQTTSFLISSVYDIENLNIIISPNPSDGNIILEMNSLLTDNYIIEIRNLLGQIVYDEKIEIQDSYKKHIDISSYGKGTYLISVSNTEGRLTKKIIVE